MLLTMKTTASAFVSSGALAALLLILDGCAHAKTTVVPPGVPVSSLGSTSMQGTQPDTSTAPVAISPEILRACDIPDAYAYFAFDSSKVTTFDYPTLDEVATCFTTGPMAQRHLDLVGHADPRGTPEYNMTLGQYRADAVSTYLRQRGASPERVSSTSRGAMDAMGQDETGWAQDRRVDVLLVK
jgi:peptidoglycan-associated lipoprotein